jgi:hypothetical protein
MKIPAMPLPNPEIALHPAKPEHFIRIQEARPSGDGSIRSAASSGHLSAEWFGVDGVSFISNIIDPTVNPTQRFP